jgi:hypothetical protein
MRSRSRLTSSSRGALVLMNNTRVQEIANDLRDFVTVRFQGEVAGVEEAHVSVWNVTLERLGA